MSQRSINTNFHEPRVSIVVPVYGVEKYVGRCFDSIVAQTYHNLECVFVDDCGNDSSMEIVRERISGYRGNVDFKIIRHAQNRGLSAARNTGADSASGEYVYFLDGDDLITPDCIALLAAPLRERRVDFVLGNYASGGDGSCFIAVRVPDGFICGNAEIRENYLRGAWFMMVWNRLVSRSFLARENLRFAEGLLHEDNLWAFQLACLADSMCVVRAPTYVYTIRKNSITTAKSRKNLDSLVRIASEMENFVRERALAADANVVRFTTMWRENLLLNAIPYRAAWETYRDAVRAHGFSRKIFRTLSVEGKLRYLHQLFPAPLGLAYALAVAKTFSAIAFFKYRFFRSS